MLLLLFRSSSIHITSKPHGTKHTDTVCTNITPVCEWAAHSAAPFCSPGSSYWHNKTYSGVVKFKTGPAFVTRKKERCLPTGERKVVYGAAARTTPRCSTSILSTNKSPLPTASLRSGSPGEEASSQKQRRSLTMHNTRSFESQVVTLKASPCLTAEAANNSTLML